MKKFLILGLLASSLCFGTDSKQLPTDLNNTELWKNLTYIDVAKANGLDNNYGNFFIEKIDAYKDWFYMETIKEKKDKSGYKEKTKIIFDQLEAVCKANGYTFRDLDEYERPKMQTRTIGKRSYGGIKWYYENNTINRDVVCTSSNNDLIFIATAVQKFYYANGDYRIDSLVFDVTGVTKAPYGNYLRWTWADAQKNKVKYFEQKEIDKQQEEVEKKQKAQMENGLMTPAQIKAMLNNNFEELYNEQKEVCDKTVAMVNKEIVIAIKKGSNTTKFTYTKVDGRGVFDASKNQSSCPNKVISHLLKKVGYEAQDVNNNSVIVSWQ